MAQSEPETGAVEAEEEYDRGFVRKIRHAMRRLVKRPLLRIGLWLTPPIYLAYMRFVWWTSRVDNLLDVVWTTRRAHDGVVGLLWHEEVFSVSWAYREHRPHTVASIGDAGEAITRALERCGFVVFRGGSARNRGSRNSRRREVLPMLVEHMKTTHDVIYGLTIDGSMGPRYRMKRGGVVIAKECRKPIVFVRTWAKRNLRLPTWDRMAIPLPFNHIRQTARGPYFVPDGIDDPEKLEAFRRHLERELARLAIESYATFGQRVPASLTRVLEETAPALAQARGPASGGTATGGTAAGDGQGLRPPSPQPS